VPLKSGDIGRPEQRVVNRFLDGFDGGQEERAHGVVVNLLDCTGKLLRFEGDWVTGRKGDYEIAGTVAQERACAGETQYGSSGQALQVARRQRRISGQHNHARTVAMISHNPLTERIAAEFLSNRNTVNSQYSVEVGLYQGTNGPAAKALWQHA